MVVDEDKLLALVDGEDSPKGLITLQIKLNVVELGVDVGDVFFVEVLKRHGVGYSDALEFGEAQVFFLSSSDHDTEHGFVHDHVGHGLVEYVQFHRLIELCRDPDVCVEPELGSHRHESF